MVKVSRVLTTTILALTVLASCATVIPTDESMDEETRSEHVDDREPGYEPELPEEEPPADHPEAPPDTVLPDDGEPVPDDSFEDHLGAAVSVLPPDIFDGMPDDAMELHEPLILESLSFDDERMNENMRRQRADRLAALRLAEMTLEEQIGQMIMPAYIFDAASRPVRSVTEFMRTEIVDVQPGGIILFGQNIDNPQQTRSFVDHLQTLTSVPLFIATDQEGGLVSRLTQSAAMPATRFPSARLIGRTGDVDYAYRVGQAIGSEMRALGINMNLAPVADVQTNPRNTVIGSRAFGADPEVVAEMVVQMVRGLQSEYILSVVKHFPGHGDSDEDSHVERVVLLHDRERLSSVELVPFRHAISAGVDGVMSAHIDLPNIFGSDLPVTLNRTALEGLLRSEMGFEGLVITDSLVMEAVSGRFSGAELAVASVEAGSDILLQPRNAVVARDAIRDAVLSGRLSSRRIQESAHRILAAKYRSGVFEPDRWLPADQSALGSERHRLLVEEIRAAAQ
ncbi:MAG: glycoside hydrolase [Spirochaetaceae bacterium]|nr:MAG: glycoside hydrolase [Spirochaetaceae bacterium]